MKVRKLFCPDCAASRADNRGMFGVLCGSHVAVFFRFRPRSDWPFVATPVAMRLAGVETTTCLLGAAVTNVVSHQRVRSEACVRVITNNDPRPGFILRDSSS